MSSPKKVEVFLHADEIDAIIQTAHDFESYIYAMAGQTADYPIRITADNKQAREEFVARMNALSEALKPVRRLKTL